MMIIIIFYYYLHRCGSDLMALGGLTIVDPTGCCQPPRSTGPKRTVSDHLERTGDLQRKTPIWGCKYTLVGGFNHLVVFL